MIGSLGRTRKRSRNNPLVLENSRPNQVESVENGCSNMPFQTLEQLERLLEIASNEGISVRNEWLSGVCGGLVRIGREPLLFIDDSLDVAEQLEQARAALSQLDWSESQWSDEMSELLDIGQHHAG
jgi:hypothetical protein